MWPSDTQLTTSCNEQGCCWTISTHTHIHHRGTSAWAIWRHMGICIFRCFRWTSAFIAFPVTVSAKITSAEDIRTWKDEFKALVEHIKKTATREFLVNSGPELFHKSWLQCVSGVHNVWHGYCFGPIRNHSCNSDTSRMEIQVTEWDECVWPLLDFVRVGCYRDQLLLTSV